MKNKILQVVLVLASAISIQAQDLGKVIIKNALTAYPKFIVSLNGIRLSNAYTTSVNFDYLEDKSYRVKLLQAGSSTVLNFVIHSELNYLSIYTLNKDNFGKYALILESKSLMTGQEELSTQTVSPQAPVPVSVTPTEAEEPVATTAPTETVITPMADADYKAMLNSVRKESLERTRLELAKTYFGNQHLSSSQVSGILKAFSLEASRVNFAKFAYSRTIDKQNYFRVYDTFTLSSSKKELADFVKNNP